MQVTIIEPEIKYVTPSGGVYYDFYCLCKLFPKIPRSKLYSELKNTKGITYQNRRLYDPECILLLNSL